MDKYRFKQYKDGEVGVFIYDSFQCVVANMEIAIKIFGDADE